MKTIKPLLLLLAAAAAISTLDLQSADKVEKAPPAAGRKASPPFGGKLTAVDTAAGTIKIGDRTFHVVSTTKIQMAGKPAKLDAAKVGDEVGGQYREGDGGRLELLSLRVGPKPEKKPKATPAK